MAEGNFPVKVKVEATKILELNVDPKVILQALTN